MQFKKISISDSTCKIYVHPLKPKSTDKKVNKEQVKITQ